MNKVAVIGLGLIGGSLALELKKTTWATIYGIDKNKNHIREALDLGIIFEEINFDKIHEMDVVIISVPVNVIPEIAVKVLDLIDEKALVFDVGSTKAEVCDSVRKHPKRRNFVALHPIAGTEFSGPQAAIYDLFTDKVNIICEKELSSPEKIEQTVALFEKLKMKNVFMESAVQHDIHIAYVSHLSHISSFMLGKTVLEIEKDEKNIFNMAGSGFASTVRLAKSNPETWTPIFMQNRDNLLKSLEEYIKNLNKFKDILTRKSAEDVLKIMEDTNRIKDVLAGIKQQ
ncbi:prephenate dehydrogenase [Lutimonas zeaxanthinifaciens]|uniref:prephenate dehydrogenase n=1 Tax=Lutimonas zeaxanthinifaciens TaxID=3060215 RepID=UPI00265CDA5B|nr:prephenate dehydrogenase [Lutimonas sp. YSD2104]WKK66093.1 prephenate dehydrogenase [Lutimonas sp. YSD2104]